MVRYRSEIYAFEDRHRHREPVAVLRRRMRDHFDAFAARR